MRFSLDPFQWDEKGILAGLGVVFLLISLVCGIPATFVMVLLLWSSGDLRTG